VVKFSMLSGIVMKKLATGIAAAALIGTPALAADMAIKGPPPAPAPIHNWTGWYVGGNVGASFGHVKTDFNGTPIFASAIGVGPVQITSGFGGSDVSHPSGFIGGGQIGYNWQYSPLIVVGLEADIQGALEKENGNWGQSFNFFNQGIAASNGIVATNYTTQIDWFGTVRGRIGYVWGNENVMSYVTGGLAYGKVALQGTSAVSGLTNGVAPFAVAERSIILTLIPAGRWATAQRA
jgi:outer membrane immunogenic protein